MRARVREVWRTAPNAPRYEVSSLGNVRRSASKVVIAPELRRNYLCVNSNRVHRMVLFAFRALDHFPGAHSRHLDGNPTNNRVSNLRWGTARENKEDAIRHGTSFTPSRTGCKSTKEERKARSESMMGRNLGVVRNPWGVKGKPRTDG